MAIGARLNYDSRLKIKVQDQSSIRERVRVGFTDVGLTAMQTRVAFPTKENRFHTLYSGACDGRKQMGLIRESLRQHHRRSVHENAPVNLTIKQIHPSFLRLPSQIYHFLCFGNPLSIKNEWRRGTIKRVKMLNNYP